MEGYLFFGPFKPNMSSFKITAFVFYVLLGVMGTTPTHTLLLRLIHDLTTWPPTDSGGLLGMLWNKAVARINNFRAQRINPKPYRRIIEVPINPPSLLMFRVSLKTFLQTGNAGGVHHQRHHLPLQYLALRLPVPPPRHRLRVARGGGGVLLGYPLLTDPIAFVGAVH